MAAQLNYGYSTPKGIPGGKFDLAEDVVVSRANDENDGVVKFGMAVAIGASAGSTIKLPVSGTTAANIEGVTLAAQNTEHDMKGDVIVKKGTILSVMKHGHVWGRLADATAPTYGAAAYVLISGANAGSFTATSGDGTTVDIGAKFGQASDVVNGIAVIELK